MDPRTKFLQGMNAAVVPFPVGSFVSYDRRKMMHPRSGAPAIFRVVEIDSTHAVTIERADDPTLGRTYVATSQLERAAVAGNPAFVCDRSEHCHYATSSLNAYLAHVCCQRCGYWGKREDAVHDALFDLHEHYETAHESELDERVIDALVRAHIYTSGLDENGRPL